MRCQEWVRKPDAVLGADPNQPMLMVTAALDAMQCDKPSGHPGPHFSWSAEHRQAAEW